LTLYSLSIMDSRLRGKDKLLSYKLVKTCPKRPLFTPSSLLLLLWGGLARWVTE
jgi:hypothetical protein